MKRTIRPLLVVMAMVGLLVAACGGAGESTTTVAPSQASTTEHMTDESMTDDTMTDTTEHMTDDTMTDDTMTDTTEHMTDDTMTDESMADMGDVLAVAEAEGDLTVFLSALDAAGIMADFHGDGPFTLFIPTDEAFQTYLTGAGMTQDELFAGTEMLQALLEYHIVDMEEDSEMVMGMGGQSFTTAGGQSLEVTVDGDTVMVGDATIERYDIHASNGIIHVVDKVLTPPEG